MLGQGKFKSPEELKERADTLRGGMAPTEKQIQMGKVLQEVAEGIGGNVKLANSTSKSSQPAPLPFLNRTLDPHTWYPKEWRDIVPVPRQSSLLSIPVRIGQAY